MELQFRKFHQIDVFVMDYVANKYLVLYSCWQHKTSIISFGRIGFIVKHYAWILSRTPRLDKKVVARIQSDLIGQIGSSIKMYSQYGFHFGKCLHVNETQIE